ncbi:hypothetical protein C0583_05500 [Candidatus Parcubacteria bacterium]|nr:MAG: hypothetical protein C0583_05500 [Candidatus Parcubacteria bacterium]
MAFFEDAFYEQRIVAITNMLKNHDSLNERLLIWGWKKLTNDSGQDFYLRPAYMGKERKILDWLKAINETGLYAHKFKNPEQYNGNAPKKTNNKQTYIKPH